MHPQKPEIKQVMQMGSNSWRINKHSI